MGTGKGLQLSGLVAAIVIAGCAGRGVGADSHAGNGWVCTGRNTSDWHCKRQSAHPGTEARIPATTPRGGQEPRPKKAALRGPATGGGNLSQVDRNQWQGQLPDLSGVDDSDVLAVGSGRRVGDSDEDNRPAPKPRPAFQHWADDSGASSAGYRTPGPSGNATPLGNYTIQLGAFGEKSGCRRFVMEQGLKGMPLHCGTLVRQGRTWWVLTYGNFASRQTARVARDKLVGNYPGLDTWIRKHSTATAASQN